MFETPPTEPQPTETDEPAEGGDFGGGEDEDAGGGDEGLGGDEA